MVAFICFSHHVAWKSRRKTILQAEVAVAAFDDAAMRAPVRIRRVKVGNADSHPIILPSDFVRALHESGKLPVVLPHKDLEKTKRALAVFWQRWKLQHGAAHSIFEHVRQEDLCLTLPVRIHGDEGRSGLTHLWFNFGNMPICSFLFTSRHIPNPEARKSLPLC